MKTTKVISEQAGLDLLDKLLKEEWEKNKASSKWHILLFDYYKSDAWKTMELCGTKNLI